MRTDLIKTVAIVFVVDALLILSIMKVTPPVDFLFDNKTIQVVLCIAAFFGVFHYFGLSMSRKKSNLRLDFILMVFSFLVFFAYNQITFFLLSVLPSLNDYRALVLSSVFSLSAYQAVMSFSFLLSNRVHNFISHKAS